MKSTTACFFTLSLLTVLSAKGTALPRRQSSSDISSHPASHKPLGGDQTNPPNYTVQSDFDFQSINLGLNQEYIELDLFLHGLAKFSAKEFEDAGLNAEDRFLIEFMADQEVGHAIALTNLLGPSRASKQCNYTYPFETVPEFIDFCQIVTRFGESGTYGFLPHLDSRPSAQILLQSITTEARQQMIFREFEGLFPMPFYFVPSITQSMQWTLLAPYVSACPSENPRIEWTNFPALNITNKPSALTPFVGPAITHNRTQLSSPGQEVQFTWENPGKAVGPLGWNYTTATNASEPRFAAWVSQYNTTYTPLYNIKNNSASTKQPNTTSVFERINDPQVNGTMFILLTDVDLYVTPYNFSLLDAHVAAGPAVYQAG